MQYLPLDIPILGTSCSQRGNMKFTPTKPQVYDVPPKSA